MTPRRTRTSSDRKSPFHVIYHLSPLCVIVIIKRDERKGRKKRGRRDGKKEVVHTHGLDACKKGEIDDLCARARERKEKEKEEACSSFSFIFRPPFFLFFPLLLCSFLKPLIASDIHSTEASTKQSAHQHSTPTHGHTQPSFLRAPRPAASH